MGMNIYLLKNGEKFEFCDADKNRHTDSLLLQIDALLEKAEIKIDDIDVYGVCVGPGSFTGIRVAVSTVKGLGVESKAKFVCLSNFDALNFGVGSSAYFLLEGFSTFVYERYFDGKVFYECCVDINEFISKFKEKNENADVYTNSEKLQNLLKMNEIPCKFAQNNIISCFLSKIESKEFCKCSDIVPVYLRVSQAELEKKKEKFSSIIGSSKIGEMSADDIDGVCSLEEILFGKTDREKVKQCLNSSMHKFMVLKYGKKVIGYVEFEMIAPDSEIFEIGVDENYQGLGIGKYLLDYLSSYLKQNKCSSIFLEVNRINKRAINLYLSSGFNSYSERKNYYGDEDAILMKKPL